MLEVLESMLKSDGGAFGFVVVMGWLAFWLHGKAKDIINKHETLTHDVDSLDARFDKRCDKIDQSIHSLREEVSYIRGTLNSLIDRNGKDEYMKAHSPLSLTDKGVATAKEMDAERIVAKNWDDRILPKMNAELPGKNPYDIQQYCLERVPVSPDSFFSPEDLDAIKLYAFRKGLPLFTCLKIFGVIIRDAYLRAKHIAVEDIDKHDPQKQH